MAKSKAVVSMKEVEKQMAVYAGSAKARINQPAGNVIGIRNSKFTYKQEVIGDELSVIALDFVHVNAWYDSDFDPENPAPPACFAISDDGKEMVPHPSSPKKQNETCDGCPQNAWGSADRGRGKSCKNQYRIACMETSSEPEEAEIALLTMPPTSQKNWGKYVTSLDTKLNRPTFGVVTKFSFDAEMDYPVILAECESVTDDAAKLTAIMGRIDSVRETLREPFDVSGYDVPARTPRRQAAPKKKARTKAKAKAAPKKKAKAKGKRGSKFS